MAPDGFRLEESRPAVLDSSSVKQTWSVCETGHGVYWWIDHSQESGADERCVPLPPCVT